ncbi:MAG: hypothetical protein Q4E89_02825 [Eubacteriales bacterium]|nr:hypothetical protein [Eubacteriales bacterium]
MKICNKCRKTFDDAAVFCPDCGERLENYQATQKQRTPTQNQQPSGTQQVPTQGNGSVKQMMSEQKKTVQKWDNSQNVFVRWLPTIFSIIGLLVAWNVSILYGGIIAAAGVVCGCFSKNQINQIISIVVGIITILICILACIL